MKNSIKNMLPLLPGSFLKKIMLNFVNLLATKPVAEVFLHYVKVVKFFPFSVQNAPCYPYYPICYIKKVYYNIIGGNIYIKGYYNNTYVYRAFSGDHPKDFESLIFGGIVGVPKGNRAKYLGEGRDTIAHYWKAFRNGNRALMEWLRKRWENRLAVLLQPGGDKTPPMLIRKRGESAKEWLDRCYREWRG